MRRLTLLASTFALVSTAAFAWDTAPPAQTPTTQVQHQGQVANGGAGGAGGAGGNAASSAASRSASRSSAGASSRVVNNVNTSSGDGSGGHNVAQAPDVYLPSIGGGGNDCPTVGFGAGGSGLGGGGGFGPSWISTDCNTRKLAELLASLGHRDAALAVLEDHFPEVKRAMTVAQPVQPASAPLPAAGQVRPAWETK